MSDRPSDGMGLDELRDEFDWMFEFQSRMAERIRDDADVHNLADYVGKLESENAKLRGARDVWQENDAKLRELVRAAWRCAIHSDHATCDDCRRMNSSCILADRMRELGVEVDG